MSIHGNMGEAFWEAAESIPAGQQEPLFEATGHGSMALADLRAMPLAQVMVHLVLIQSGYACSLLQVAFERIPRLKRMDALVEMGRQHF